MQAELVNLSQKDIELNLKQELSSEQIQRLELYRLKAGLRLGGLIASIIILIASFWMQFYVALPVLLFWMWILRSSPQNFHAINKDLKQKSISFIRTNIHTDIHYGMGIIQIPHYSIITDTQHFELEKSLWLKFRNHKYYQLYFASQSGVFLGAILMSQPDEVEVNPPQEILAQFNERQLEILALIGDGLSNKEIAQNLHLSVNTIKMYASQIYEILYVNRRTEAVAKARELGILS